MPEAIIKYSQLIQDDGGFDKLEQDLESLGKKLTQKASAFKKDLQFIDVRDTENIRRLEKEIMNLTRANNQLTKSKAQAQSSRKKSVELTKKEVSALELEREAQRKNRQEATALAKLKSAQAGSIEELRAKLSVVTIEWAKLSQEERENTARGERLIRVKKELTEELKKVERATGDNRRNVGNYKDEVKQAIRELEREKAELIQNTKELKHNQSELKKGSSEWLQYQKRIDDTEKKLTSINAELGDTNLSPGGGGGFEIPSGGFSSIGSGIGDILSSIGPVGIALGSAVAGAVALGDAILKVEERFTNLKSTASGLGLGAQLDSVVESAVALSDTFGDDETEVLRTQNVLMKEFGLNAEEAFQIVERGYINGANANGELTESIQEYATQVKTAGGSANDLLNILEKSNEEGIFSDKGIDVVKEFGLRIREQTSATKDALDNAFGKKFTKKLFDGLNDGSISTVDALAQVSQGLNDTGLSAQQVQTVIADVFGGPGEDAGLRYLQSLKDINVQQNEYLGLADPILLAQREQSRLNLELAEAQNKVATQFQGSGIALENWGIQLKTVFYNSLATVGEFINDVGEGLGNLFNFEDATLQSAGLKQTLDALTPSLGGLTDEWFKLTEAERKAVAEQKAYNQVSEIATEIIKDEVFDINNKVSALYDENLSQEERNELLQKLIDKYPQYKDQLVDENGNLKDLATSRRDLNKTIIESAVARAKEAVFTQTINDIIEKQIDLVAKQQKQQKKQAEGYTTIELLDLYYNGSEVQQANEDLQDTKDLLSALSTIDLGGISKEIEAIFNGINLDGAQETFSDEITKQKDELVKLQSELDKIENKLASGVSDEVRTKLEKSADVLTDKIEALKKQLNLTNEEYLKFLGLTGEDTGDGKGKGKGSGGGSSTSKLKDKELDLIDEINQKRNELRQDGLEKDLEAIDLRIQREVKGFEKLRAEQDKLRKAGVISEEVYQGRIDQINTIEALAEEERQKIRQEIINKYSIKEVQDYGKLQIEKLKLANASEVEIQQQVLQNLRDEINIRKQLADITVEEKQKLIELEVAFSELQKKLAENEADAIRALEDVQVQGSIDEVERQIQDQENLIAELGEKAGKEEIDRLKYLLDQKYQLRKRAIEDEYDYQLSKVEDGSLEEQRIIEEKNNALKKLEHEHVNEVEDINKQSLQKRKDDWQEFVDELKSIIDQILEKMVENAQKEVDLAQDKLDKQSDAVDEQRARAQQGLSNTLAFEKEEEAKREAEKIKAQKKLERIQKVQTFWNNYNARLNSLKEGEDASKALFGALKDLAIAEVITASFGEGGIVGVDGYEKVRTTSKGITVGKSHKMDGGVPAYFEGGEGFFSKQEVKNLGQDGFYQLKQIAGNKQLARNMFKDQRVQFHREVPFGGYDVGLADDVRQMKETIKGIESVKWDVEGFTRDILTLKKSTYEGGKLKSIGHIQIKGRN